MPNSSQSNLPGFCTFLEILMTRNLIRLFFILIDYLINLIYTSIQINIFRIKEIIFIFVLTKM